MSLTTSVQDWLGGLGRRERSGFVARRHIAAETSTDVDAICATISPDVFFAIPVRTTAGHELRAGTVLTDAAQVRGYYEGRSGSYLVRDSAQLKSITTDWYVCNETTATLLGTGDVNGVDATGREWVVSSVVLFPTAADGIRGEVCATRHPMDAILRGTVSTEPLPGAEAAHGQLLDRFSLAVRAADWDAAGSALAPGHTLAVRLDPVEGPPVVHQSTASLPALFGPADDLT
ncbi:MAG: hypothetical protein JWO68_3280, partial [Actinomycetia bacterium]|nr:hypothetical protein [Actinomycetes bacterium]